MLYIYNGKDASGNKAVMLATTENEKEVYLNAFIEELRLFKGENPTDTDAGLDYFGILNGEKFLQVEARAVIEKHLPNFASIETEKPYLSDDEEQIIMPMQITFKDGELLETALVIDRNVI